MEPLKLLSPANTEPLVFNWPLVTQDKKEGVNELIETIKAACEHYHEIKSSFNYHCLHKNFNEFKNYDHMKKICDDFNQVIEKLHSTNSLDGYKNKRATMPLLRFIMHYIYNRAVYDPEKLNQYEPFSPQVYGETSFDLVNEMLKRVKLSDGDIFIDLGSGVGNVVLQVAATVDCKLSYGVEKAECPAEYAAEMGKEFKTIMNWFGKTYSNFIIDKGDFLDDNEKSCSVNIRETINEAKLIFVNNYAFGAEVDHQLKLRFSNMTEGAIILSSKPFCPLNFRINSRNLNDIGAILNVNEFDPLNGHVSWTDKPINYYFHKIDRTLLEKYFERLKNPKAKDDESDNRKKTSKRSNSTDEEIENKMSPRTNKKVKKEAENGKKSSTTVAKPNKVHEREVTKQQQQQQQQKDDKPLTRAANSTNHVQTKNNQKTLSQVNSVPSSSTSSSVTAANKSNLDNNNYLDILDSMHKEAVKASLMVPANGNTAATGGNSNKISNGDLNSNFNVKSMTKLANSNVDFKSLKECSIMDLNEYDLREQLGPDVSMAVDNYLKTCRVQLFNYLVCMKSPQYKDVLKTQIQHELKVQNEIIKKTNQLEKQIDTLVKSSISLLKTRVSELGLNNIERPHELIQFATKILGNHQELLNKVNNLQQVVDEYQRKNESLTNTVPLAGNATSTTSTVNEINNFSSMNDSFIVSQISKLFEVNNNHINKSHSVAGNSSSSSSIGASGGHCIENTKPTNTYLDLFEPISPTRVDENTNLSSEHTLSASEREDTRDDYFTMDEYKRKKHETTNKRRNSNENLKLKKNQSKDPSTYFSTIKSADTLRNFKIPKSSAQTSTASSFTKQSNEQLKFQVKHENSSSDDYDTTSKNQYFHPKKSQCRQYVMENNQTKPK